MGKGKDETKERVSEVENKTDNSEKMHLNLFDIKTLSELKEMKKKLRNLCRGSLK